MAIQFSRGNHAKRCRNCGSFIPNRSRVVCRSCGYPNMQYRKKKV